VSDDVENLPPPPGWTESLNRAKAEIAAGQTVAMEPLLERLRASAERLEHRRAEAIQKA
jgi:hypothetical protein